MDYFQKARIWRVIPDTGKFAACANIVREVGSCGECLHFAECRRAGVPVSRLGFYAAWLAIVVTPKLETMLNSVATSRLRLKVDSPYGNEVEKAAIVIRAYRYEPRHVGYRLFFRVWLKGDEEYEEIVEKVLRAQARALLRRIKRNGK